MSNAHVHPIMAAALAPFAPPETRMATFTTKTKAWLPPSANTLTPAKLMEPGNMAAVFYTEIDMGRHHGWRFVGNATITIEVPEPEGAV